MERAEQQLRLIQAVYRVESGRQRGKVLSELRARSETLLDLTAHDVDGDARLRELLHEIRHQVRALP